VEAVGSPRMGGFGVVRGGVWGGIGARQASVGCAR